VNKAATTTSVVSSKNPSIFGQTVVFTATVGSGAGTPTGTVTLKDGSTTLGTSALSGGQVVNSANTLVFLSASPNPTTVGQTVTMTATVSIQGTNKPVAPSGCLLTGSVDFKDDTTTLGSESLDDNCQAIFSTASLAIGDHPIIAEYGGDGSYTGSVSNLLQLMIDYIYIYLPFVGGK